MTKQDYLDRIAKKEADIEKINKRISKWTAKVTDNKVIDLAKRFAETEYGTELRNQLRSEFNNLTKDLSYSDNSNAREVLNAYSDLYSANETLGKYHIKLSELINYENEDKIEVLVEFLANWKENVRVWYIRRCETFIQMKKDYDKEFDKIKSEYNYSELNRSQQYTVERNFRSRYYEDIPSLVKELVEYGDQINTEKLNTILDKEVKAKYKDLVKRISAVVGEIKDVSNLSIGKQNGEINGFVSGTKGKAQVETISAGGWNIQTYHYRVLVKKIKS